MTKNQNISDLIHQIKNGDIKSIARGISWVENRVNGYQQLLEQTQKNIPIIGITGPPGAGKSTLVNELIRHYTNDEKKVAMIAIDPSSPFNLGALLGDRIRMLEHINNENVYIRSLATRGSLGGLSTGVFEAVDLLKTANFDIILVETVGVGQSEIDIAALADVTLVVLVPEAGDEIQTLKSGLMEIANIFVVNKSDRDGADKIFNTLSQMVMDRKESEHLIPIIKTNAVNGEGMEKLCNAIQTINCEINIDRKLALTYKRLINILSKKAIEKLDLNKIKDQLKIELKNPNFNIYSFSNKL